MTITLPRNVLAGILLVVLAWGGAVGFAFVVTRRAENRISDYASCDLKAWNTYKSVVIGRTYTFAESSAAYDVYANERVHCDDALK